jgi:ribosomal protein S18 acetylase RimI-like enzyme
METLTLKSGLIIDYHRLRKGDETALKDFHKALCEDSKDLFTPHAYDDDTIAKVITRSEADDDRAYVVTDGARIVAYFFLWWFQTEFPVLGIGIADDFQGQGLGRQLMAVLIADAKAKGCQGVELTTIIRNEKAFSLYEKMGFKNLGQVDNRSGNGRIVNEWHMFYPIVPNAVPPERSHEPPV